MRRIFSLFGTISCICFVHRVNGCPRLGITPAACASVYPSDNMCVFHRLAITCMCVVQRVNRCPSVGLTLPLYSPQSGHFISSQTHTAVFVWFAKSMQPHRNTSNHGDTGGLDESNVEFESDANHCFYCMTLCDHFLIQSKPFCHQKLLILFCTRSTFD